MDRDAARLRRRSEGSLAQPADEGEAGWGWLALRCLDASDPHSQAIQRRYCNAIDARRQSRAVTSRWTIFFASAVSCRENNGCMDHPNSSWR